MYVAQSWITLLIARHGCSLLRKRLLLQDGSFIAALNIPQRQQPTFAHSWNVPGESLLRKLGSATCCAGIIYLTNSLRSPSGLKSQFRSSMKLWNFFAVCSILSAHLQDRCNGQNEVLFGISSRAPRLDARQVRLWMKTMIWFSSGRPRRFKSDRGPPTTMYSLIVADGTCGPVYLQSSQRASLVLRNYFRNVTIDFVPLKCARRGEEGMLAFLNQCIGDGTLVRGDLLLSDNEPSFKTKAVDALLNRAGMCALTDSVFLILRYYETLFSCAIGTSAESVRQLFPCEHQETLLEENRFQSQDLIVAKMSVHQGGLLWREGVVDCSIFL